MPLKSFEVIKAKDAEIFDIFGEGVARRYVWEDDVRFGTFIVPPYARGGVDKGHPKGEAFYVAKGKMAVFAPGLEKYLEVDEGDIIVIPPGEDHQLVNIGAEELVTVYYVPL